MICTYFTIKMTLQYHKIIQTLCAVTAYDNNLRNQYFKYPSKQNAKIN